MDTYDYLMIVVLLGATVFGFIKGLAWQIASIASLILSYMIALRFSPQIAPFFGEQEPWNRFIAMLVIYIGCSFAIWMVFRAVSSVIDRVKLKEFDHQMGALLGFAKGVLLCVAITFFAVTLLPDERREQIIASRSGHYIVVLLKRTDAIVPEEIHNVIGPYLDRVQDSLDPNQEVAPPHLSPDMFKPEDWEWSEELVGPQTAVRPSEQGRY